MNTTTMTTLEPGMLGFWTRCIRETSHWSQEAVAAAAGLDVRTIQRIEAGKPVSITTRRSLARGLGYENLDAFDDPEIIASIHKFLDFAQSFQKEELNKQFPNHVRVEVARVASGEALGRLAYASNGLLLNADDDVSLEAKQIAATLFDYMRDLQDLDDASFSEKLGFNRDLEAMLRELEGLGAFAYSAHRETKIVGANWVDKTPMPFAVGYVTIVPAEKVLQEMMVPRRLS